MSAFVATIVAASFGVQDPGPSIVDPFAAGSPRAVSVPVVVEDPALVGCGHVPSDSVAELEACQAAARRPLPPPVPVMGEDDELAPIGHIAAARERREREDDIDRAEVLRSRGVGLLGGGVLMAVAGIAGIIAGIELGKQSVKSAHAVVTDPYTDPLKPGRQLRTGVALEAVGAVLFIGAHGLVIPAAFMLGRARNLERRAMLSLGPRSVVFALRF